MNDSNQTDSQSVTTSKRRLRIRRLAGFLIVLTVLSGIWGWWWWTNNRFKWQIEAAGGKYYRAIDSTQPSLNRTLHRIWDRLNGGPVYEFDVVEFHTGKVNDEWLRTHRAQLEELSQLTLVLEDTAVTDQGLAHLHGLENLHALDLSGTPLPDSSLNRIVNFPALVSLDIAQTGISDAALAELIKAPNLYGVCIDASQATESGITHLAELPKIAMLTVFGANDETLSHFGPIDQMTSITLHDAHITNASIPVLKTFRGVTLLSFVESDLTDEQLREFKVALPGCHVQHITAKEIAELREAGW